MLTEDVALQSSDISSLDGRDAVRDFLGRLGYDVSQARQTFPEAEGMPQRLQEVVKYLELVSSDAPFLDVYLIELSSVTVASIQLLATHFKSGSVLAIITQDYSRLDFVLFDRRLTEAKSGGNLAVRVLPRRFSLDRRHPDDRLRVIQRFLRRLTWTEPDGLAQWDKLRSAFSIAEWSEEFFDNRGLFADYYLKNRLPEHPGWTDAALRPARDQVRQEISAARAQFRSEDEATLRGGLLVPLLSGLGFQPRECKGASDDSTRAPDYELLDPQSGDKLAVCLAYQWDRALDGPDPKDQQTPDENPGAAVLELLQDNEWAIVTNGKHWRLYSARTESRATNFYQVDAEEIAADPEGDAFRYFWLMFRADAFRPCEIAVAGEPRTACFLEELLDGSRRYAKEVGDRLKVRVFQDIFPILAEGFIGEIRHRDGDDANLGEERLGLVYNATLTLLYRLLFLLYAESRDLLPVAEIGGYYEKSLTELKREVGDTAGTAEGQRDEHLIAAYKAEPDQTSLWTRLTDLFAIIGDGRSELNVPKYNGGLFLTRLDEAVEDHERELAEFLSTHALSDQHLAGAIDRLARDPDDKTHGLVMIDFKSLGVRQLGSIYEGLLEFKVRIAQETMAVCTEKSREVILPYAEAAKKKGVTIKRKGRGRDAEEEVYQPGHVYLENSKHERKASGSYYTPDYIVKYIVEHTVGPVLDEKLEALRGDLNRACGDYRKFREAKEAVGVTPVSVRPEEWPLIGQCFDLSVLDPAMGSGHFLVTAVDFVADRLIHFLNGFPHNPVERMLNDTRRAIVDQAVREGLVLDESKLTHINLLKRHVLKRCIYGVDLNPMAVELAKVSLWLHCFTLGAPLSFLDHHLKWGNSLIGETGATGQEQAPQGGFDDFSRWYDFSDAVQAYLRISGSEDATVAQVTASRDGFRKAEAILRPHRQELNVQTAGYFVEPKSATKRATWVGRAEQRKTAEGKEGWQQAQNLGGEHRFFHWPLEFPEVWYEPRPGAEQQAVLPKTDRDAGFDAVFGNPPYIRIQNLREASPEQPVYLKAQFTAAGTGSYDIYVVFVERGLQVLNATGLLGLILPNKFITTDYGEPLRHLLSQRHSVRALVDFQHHQVFETATTYTCLLFLQNTPTHGLRYLRPRPSDIIDGTEDNCLTKVSGGADEWSFADDAMVGIDAKLAGAGLPLLDLPSSISRGSSTGDDTVFVLLSDGSVLRDHSGNIVEIEEEILKVPLFATDFGRYRFAPRDDKRIVFPYQVEESGYRLLPEDEFKATYPRAYDYLCRNRAQLDARKQTGPWYGFSASRNLDVHQRAQLLVPLLADRGSFAAIGGRQCQYCLMASGGFSIAVEDERYSPMYVLGLLNSTLLYWRLARISNVFRAGWVTCTKQYVATLPIRTIDFNNTGEVACHDRMVEMVQAVLDLRERSAAATPREESSLESQITDAEVAIDHLVYELYGLMAEEVAIVEGTEGERPLDTA